MKYRKDIDGLRALAILPVVLFHLDIALFSGGFVGVDVFFVISGFLITTILYSEIQAGEFSYARFYERRIRRLLPALTAMLAVTGAASWFLLMPTDFFGFSEGLAAAALFLANVYYWDTTDYFGDPVESIPLLHTWSLAVEEQFYILFPPLLFLLVRYTPVRLNLILLVGAVLSLMGAQHALATRPESAFYLVHLRAWELLAGALLATGLLPALSRQRVRDGLSLLGLTLIVCSVFLLDKQDAFPGLAAVPAVLGTTMIIHAGTGGVSLVGRWLGIRPLVFIGLISYSLYLWHWPLFVFVRYVVIEPFGALQQLALLVAALLLGWLSWRFVERPFRHHSADRRELRVMFYSSATAVLALVLASLPGMLTGGAAFRFPPEIASVEAVGEEVIPFRKPCFGLTVEQVKAERAVCALGAEGAPRFLLWGDSHALSLAHGVDLAAKERYMAGRFLARSACPPVLGAQEFRVSSVSCREFNDEVINYIRRNPSIRQVILVGFWSYYLDSPESDAEPASVEGLLDFRAGFERTLGVLNEMGITVTIVAQVPKIDYHVPSALARTAYFESDAEIGPPLSQHRSNVQSFNEYMALLADEYSFRLLDPESVFCRRQSCQVQMEGRPLYRDTGHLSRFGSEKVKDLMAVSLDQSAPGEASPRR